MQPFAPLYWLCGELTGETIIVSTSHRALVRAIVDRHSRGDVPHGDPALERRAVAAAVATELQARLLTTALRAQTWSFEGANSAEIDTLWHQRGETHFASLTWTSRALPLVVVPMDADETPPADALTLPIRWADDRWLLHSLIRTGMLAGGLVDKTSDQYRGVRQPDE